MFKLKIRSLSNQRNPRNLRNPKNLRRKRKTKRLKVRKVPPAVVLKVPNQQLVSVLVISQDLTNQKFRRRLIRK
jgi:hypothetical protein